MTMQPGRNKTFTWLAVSLAIGAALVIAVAMRPAGVDKWQAMARRVDQLRLEALSRKSPRSPLRGELKPGKAWDEYNIALNDTMTWVDDQNGSLFARFVNDEKGVDRAKVEQLVASHATAIDHLRNGAQRSDGQYPYKWERGNEMELPSILGSRRLANVASAQARIWAEKGRPEDAAGLLLDTTVFSRDLATNGTLLSSLIGYALYQISFDELRHLILSGKLSQQQLADLERKLEVVDRDFPGLSETLSNEAMGLGTSMLHGGNLGLSPKEWFGLVEKGDWRLALAPRSSMLEAFETTDRYAQRWAKLDQMDYKAAATEANAISAEAAASRNSLVNMSIPSISRSIAVQRETMANLRVLRAGTKFLATRKVPKIADPFGTNLLYKEEGGKLKIWSVGSDRGQILLEIPR
jgi:hypothetical protein